MKLEVREIGSVWVLGYEGMDTTIKGYKSKSAAVKAGERYIKKYSAAGGTVKVTE